MREKFHAKAQSLRKDAKKKSLGAPLRLCVNFAPLRETGFRFKMYRNKARQGVV